MRNTLSVVLKPNGQKIYGERPGVGSKKSDFPVNAVICYVQRTAVLNKIPYCYPSCLI